MYLITVYDENDQFAGYFNKQTGGRWKRNLYTSKYISSAKRFKTYKAAARKANELNEKWFKLKFKVEEENYYRG